MKALYTPIPNCYISGLSRIKIEVGEDIYTDPGSAYFLTRYVKMEKGETREAKKKHATYKWYNSLVYRTFNK